MSIGQTYRANPTTVSYAGTFIIPGTLKEQLRQLFTIQKDPTAATKICLFFIGVILSPLGFFGAIHGYKLFYNRFWKEQHIPPRLYDLPLICKVSMAVWSVGVWVIVLLVFSLIVFIAGEALTQSSAFWVFIGTYLAVCLFICFRIYGAFRSWQIAFANAFINMDKEGSAHPATAKDLEDYIGKQGYYLGEDLRFAGKGHLLTCGAARSGKGENIIIPNLLGVGGYDGNWVVLDIKAELISICGDSLRSRGYNVVTINPWNVMPESVGERTSYNPLALLSDKLSIDLCDDVLSLCELLVPIDKDDKNKFFTDSARNMLAGLMLHLVTTDDSATVGKLYEWTRYPSDKFDQLLIAMAGNDNPVNGYAVRNAANEILSQMQNQETYGSIKSSLLRATNFLQSLPIQQSLSAEGGFDPYSLGQDGKKTAVFIVVPSDKKDSHANLLRLMMISMLRAVVRKPNPEIRTTFLIDEASSLGYLTEVETALAVYAGLNISLWLIYQDLNQLVSIYGDKWQSVIANSSIRSFAGIRDNFSAEYVSAAMGTQTRTIFTKGAFGSIKSAETSKRELLTPGEVVEKTEHNIILFAGSKPPAIIPKNPYYLMRELKDKEGENLYNPNPYIKDSL